MCVRGVKGKSGCYIVACVDVPFGEWVLSTAHSHGFTRPSGTLGLINNGPL